MLFIIILIFLLFVPIPIKTNVSYNSSIITLKIYNKSIVSFNFKTFLIYINKKKEPMKTERKIFFIKKFFRKKEVHLKKLILSLKSNKLKPFIKIKTNINFGISDAAICSIVYGLLWNLPTFIKAILDIVFNVKNISLSINPKFNTNHLLFNINSIFYISFANIIYIIFLLFKSLKNKEEIINE